MESPNRALYPYVRKCHAHKHYQNKSESITDNYCGKFRGDDYTTGTLGQGIKQC